MRSLFLAGLVAASAVSAPAFASDVTVRVTGVEARGGHLLAALSSGATFLQATPEYGLTGPGDQAGVVVLVFHDVAPGDYALSVMHDSNNNEQFDMGPMGPVEGYVFSNMRGPLMAMPTFDDHKFTVGADDATVTVAISYPMPMGD
jgi:uncharacterized protein (DUF2141 family)